MPLHACHRSKVKVGRWLEENVGGARRVAIAFNPAGFKVCSQSVALSKPTPAGVAQETSPDINRIVCVRMIGVHPVGWTGNKYPATDQHQRQR